MSAPTTASVLLELAEILCAQSLNQALAAEILVREGRRDEAHTALGHAQGLTAAAGLARVRAENA